MAAFTRKLQAANLDYKDVEKLLVSCKSVYGWFPEASKIKPMVEPLQRMAKLCRKAAVKLVWTVQDIKTKIKISALVAFVDV